MLSLARQHKLSLSHPRLYIKNFRCPPRKCFALPWRAAVEDYLLRHAELDFDEIEIVNNRPMNVWLYTKCRRCVDPDEPEDEQVTDAEVEVAGPYDDNPTGM
jgi:hypothetical protein